MTERVLVTVHGEVPVDAFRHLTDLCAHLIRPGEEPVVQCREVGDPDDGPVSFEFYVGDA